MGLDNGIIARKSNNEKINAKLLALSTYTYSKGDHEIAYWRKCWNVRGAIANVMGGIYDNEETPLMYEDVIAVIKRLKQFNEKNWSGDSWDDGSIWEWDEIKKNHRGCIKRLQHLARLMKKYPGEIDVYFYDSY
jgi:hypothetical protein